MEERPTRHGSKTIGSFFLFVVFALCAAGSSEAALRAEGVLRPDAIPACAYGDPLMDPSHSVWRGHDFVWQVPARSRAVLLYLHGERQDPFLYFDPGPGCVDCYGLPETRRVVMDALRRGYAVIAIKSIAVTWDRWPYDNSADAAMIEGLLSMWRREHSLERLPLVVWGHSSGGYFATGLAEKMRVQGMVLSVCEGQTQLIERAAPDWFPPTFFSYMAYDGDTGLTRSKDIEESMKKLRERNVPVAGKVVYRKPLSPLFFAKHIRCMTEELSERVYEAYRDAGWLDDDGYLVVDPEFIDWLAVLKTSGALPPCVQLDGDPCLSRDICQELKIAHGTHTFSSEIDQDIYSFLEKNALSSSDSLSAVY